MNTEQPQNTALVDDTDRSIDRPAAASSTGGYRPTATAQMAARLASAGVDLTAEGAPAGLPAGAVEALAGAAAVFGVGSREHRRRAYLTAAGIWPQETGGLPPAQNWHTHNRRVWQDADDWCASEDLTGWHLRRTVRQVMRLVGAELVEHLTGWLLPERNTEAAAGRLAVLVSAQDRIEALAAIPPQLASADTAADRITADLTADLLTALSDLADEHAAAAADFIDRPTSTGGAAVDANTGGGRPQETAETGADLLAVAHTAAALAEAAAEAHHRLRSVDLPAAITGAATAAVSQMRMLTGRYRRLTIDTAQETEAEAPAGAAVPSPPAGGGLT